MSNPDPEKKDFNNNEMATWNIEETVFLAKLLKLIPLTEETSAWVDLKGELEEEICAHLDDYDGEFTVEAITNYLTPKAPEFKPLQRYDETEEYKQKIQAINEKKSLERQSRSELVHEQYDDYEEWRAFEDEDQSDRIDDLITKMERTPTKWDINFDEFNAKSKLTILSRLKEFFNDYIANMAESKDYEFSFKVFGRWFSKPLTPELYRQLLDNFSKVTFTYEYAEPIPESISDPAIEEIPEWSYFTAIGFRKKSRKRGNKDRGGHFFKYLVENVPENLKKYLINLQIFDSLLVGGEVRSELNDCCFIYALRRAGIPEDTLNKMKLVINSRFLSPNKIDQLCTNHSIHCKCLYIDEEASASNKKHYLTSTKNKKKRSYLGVDDETAKYHVNLACYEEHYFIEEKTAFSKYFIDHLDELQTEALVNSDDPEAYIKSFSNKELKDGRYRTGRYYASSSYIVNTLMKKNHFRRITYGEYGLLKTVFFDEVKDDLTYSLDYEDSSVRLIERKDKDKEFMDDVNEIFYADFEADVSKESHQPFMVCAQNQSGTKSYTFKGGDCAEQFLSFLPDKSLVYFHNLAYDIRMMAHFGISRSLIKGSKVLSAEIEYGTITYKKNIKGIIKICTRPKKIYFKDTLPILNCKLAALPARFNLPDVQKELFPYKYYTLERLESNEGVIEEAGLNEDSVWTEDEYKIFNENIDSIPGCRIDDKHFKMYEYSEFYCMQDVNVLRRAFNKFQKDFYKDFGINVFNELTISGIANKVFRQRVYEPNGNLYEVSGHVQKFIQRAVRGGRCMTAFNRKWRTNVEISDFDAVSLYPSAMARLYTVEGKPHVIQPEQLNLDFLSKQSAYIVEIKVTKVNKHYAFPLLVQKIDGLNVNNDIITDPVTIVVDNIGLEDLINFQGVEFEFIRGYYWDGKRDYRIQKVIRDIFNKRLEYKKQKNSLQELYKLIMNSCYGKTIQKPVKVEHRYIEEENFEKFWYKNYYKIVEYTKINNSSRYDVKIIKQIDNQFNFSLMGVQVLSMSKRIMNEVMCLAYDLGIRIYYQDTDSMHVERDELPRLAEEFRKKYNRELIGKDMGQFHSDFEPINGHDEVPYAIESLFIAKKIYVDKLTDSTKETSYHIRGKGLTQNSIKQITKDEYGNDFIKMYEALYNGDELTFDLTAGQPSFDMKNDFTISSRKEFLRHITCNLPEGKIDEYFTY